MINKYYKNLYPLIIKTAASSGLNPTEDVLVCYGTYDSLYILITKRRLREDCLVLRFVYGSNNIHRL